VLPAFTQVMGNPLVAWQVLPPGDHLDM